MDLVSGQGRTRKGGGGHGGSVLGAVLLAGKDRVGGQQPQPPHGLRRTTLRALRVGQRLAQHLIPAADGTPEGCVQDNVFGTYLHGLFDTGELTEKLLALLCQRKGIAPDSAALIPMEQYRQQQFDLLADGVRGALDLDAVYAAMGLENPRRNAQ